MSGRIYFIAGEASGDLHGGNLIRALKLHDPGLECRGFGGDEMASAGCNLVRHYRDLAFMGFVEVLRNLPAILGNLRFVKADIDAFRPDAVVLIDYPGFNLRVLPHLHKRGIPAIYYISPQLWAWHKSRVKLIRKYVDLLLVILPFEPGFYAREGITAHYVGHPLVSVIDRFRLSVDIRRSLHLDPERELVAVLPGSRQQEVRNMLPIMAALAARHPETAFVVAEAPALSPEIYAEILSPFPGLFSVRGQTYDLLSVAGEAIVTSGTATLETALFRVPQVVAYKGSPLSYWIAKRLVRLSWISLVNLLLDRTLVTELIQRDLTVDRLDTAFKALKEPESRQRVLEGYDGLRAILGDQDASARAAALIREFLWEEGTT